MIPTLESEGYSRVIDLEVGYNSNGRSVPDYGLFVHYTTNGVDRQIAFIDLGQYTQDLA